MQTFEIEINFHSENDFIFTYTGTYFILW